MTEQTLPLSLVLHFLQLQGGEECGWEEFGIFNRIEGFFFFFWQITESGQKVMELG